MTNTVKTLFFLVLFVCPLGIHAQFFENFEQGTKNAYATGYDQLETGEWLFDDALIGTTAGDKKNGSRSARIRNGFIEMNFDYPDGFVEISFFGANFSNDAGGAVQVSYSTNGGSSWTNLGDPIGLTSELTQYSLSGSVEGNVRLRFAKTSGNRINIDDIFITEYIETTEEPRLLMRINDVAYEHGSTFNFGTTTGLSSATLQIRNGGQQDLVISSYTISGQAFSVDGDLQITLSSLETATFSLLFDDETPGIHNGSLTIHSNDPENPQFTVHLTAETLDTSQPIPISEARLLPQGTLVTVAGWVTVADQFAGPVYFQDETAGIAWYNGAIMRDEWLVGAVIGDSILVTGELGNFNNLLQIVNDTEFEVFPESNMVHEPLDITLEQLNTGMYEGWLVRVTDIEFEDSGIFSGGTNYTVFDPSGQGQLRVDNFTNIPGTNIPNSLTEVTGVAGRFQAMHQLLPRFTQDLEILSGPVIISTPPYEVSATANSITFKWETALAGHSEVRYGTTASLELGKIIDETHKTQHSITIPDLFPASIYKVQLRSAFDADTSATAIHITTTRSPAGTTGAIHVYFNKDVVHELATIREADENIDMADKLIEYIQLADENAEFAFYNLSGNVGSIIANEIIHAHNRGVAVRVIVSGHTGSTNELVTHMAAAGVNAVQSTGTQQMHNKFAIFDANHSDPSVSRLITSSWNSTDQGTYNQFQNMVVIQDVALARAYLREFNQMWGGESGSFSPSNALFAHNKTIVNPSVFWIGDNQTRIELFFSPQANTESHINRALRDSQLNIDFAQNIITRRPISNTMLDRFNQGVKVRGVMGAISGQGNEFDYLSSWADVHHLSQAEFGLLHHKYAIVDGEATSSNSRVITGSHNWSANANFSNDENTLIIYSQRVANEYLQEFAARYWQAGGVDEFNVSVSVPEIDYAYTQPDIFLRNYPNPVGGHTTIEFRATDTQRVSLYVFDMFGRRVATLLENLTHEPGFYSLPFNAEGLPAGIYFYHLQFEDGRGAVQKMSVVNK
ncbi:MAG: T9SS C-terminal target domain-containing protein [Bacteroidia bacterium]|nr:MAG: T9SS C-terminal target domain-containing protein [Bacteroidia bacterium]